MLHKLGRSPILRGLVTSHRALLPTMRVPVRFFALEQRGYREPYDFDYITSIFTYLDVDGSFNT